MNNAPSIKCKFVPEKSGSGSRVYIRKIFVLQKIPSMSSFQFYLRIGWCNT